MRTRPQTFDRLLAERAGIGPEDLDEFEALHARANRFWRAAFMRQAQRTRPEPERERIERAVVPAEHLPVPPPDDVYSRARAMAAEEARHEKAAIPEREPRKTDWRTLYDDLRRDWNALVARAEGPDLPLPLMDGYDALLERVRALASLPALAPAEREVIAGLLDYHDVETAAREAVRDYLAAAELHVKAFEPLRREAERLGVHLSSVAGYRDWREDAGRLAGTGRAILADEDSYGAYLDATVAGKPRVRLTVEQLLRRIEQGRVEAPKQERPQPGYKPAPGEATGFVHIFDDPEKLAELRKQLRERERREDQQRRKSRHISMRI